MTKKDQVRSQLLILIALTPKAIHAGLPSIPRPSIRRILRELVAQKQAEKVAGGGYVSV